MYPAESLVDDFERNRAIVARQAEGLSHEDSLLQPPGDGNCLNWTIGHILVHRDKVIRDSGGRSVLSESQTERYARESDPITVDGEDVIQLPTLLELLDQSQQRLSEAVPATDLSQDHATARGPIPLWKRFHFLYFHDTYHTGQTELLRSLAGFGDRVI